MQHINTRRSLLVLGALGLALLPLSGAAQAKPKDKDKGGPPDHAPAYGRRNKDGKYKGNKNRDRDYDRDDYGSRNDDWDDDYDYDRDRDRDRDYDRGNNNGGVRPGNFGRIVTLEGVVTSVSGSDSFRVQAGGRSFDVNSDSNLRVRTGQRVVLRGSFDENNDFNARKVSIVDRSNGDPRDNDPYGDDYLPGNDRRVNFPGVVTRVLSNGELEVRAENGRTYRVDPRDNSSEYQVGNRIRVTGTASGNRVENARITFQNGGVAGGIFGNAGGIFGNAGNIFGNGGDVFGNGGGSVSSNDQKVNFVGRILSVNNSSRTAIVRGDNGRQYSVRGGDLKNYRNGERVRVRGVTKDGSIQVSDIDRI